MLTCDSDLASEQEVLHLHHFICNTWRSFESHGSGNAAHEIKNGTSKPGEDQELKKTPPEHREKLPRLIVELSSSIPLLESMKIIPRLLLLGSKYFKWQIVPK